jgi:hypothetical protein
VQVQKGECVARLATLGCQEREARKNSTVKKKNLAEFVRTGVKKHRESQFQRRVKRFLHPYFDAFLQETVWKPHPTDDTDPLESLALEPAVQDPRRAALVRYQIDKVGLQERFSHEVARWVRFSVRIFQSRKVSTIAEARIAAGILLDGYLEKDTTPNGMACTFFRALREHTVVADAVIQLAAVAVPTRTVKSRATQL